MMITGPTRNSGVTLMELLLVIAVMSVVMAIAVPTYQNYIESSKIGVMRNNLETLRLFQEQYRLEKRTYVNGVFDPNNPEAAGGLKSVLGWDPQSTEKITYTVTLAGRNGYSVSAVDETGISLALTCDSKKCLVVE